MATDSACEMKCLSFKLSVRLPREDFVDMLFIFKALEFFKLNAGNIKITSVGKKLPVPVAARLLRL
jgi:hypothetical protein